MLAKTVATSPSKSKDSSITKKMACNTRLAATTPEPVTPSFRPTIHAAPEVLSRDASLNNQLNQDKGDLNGHYGQLKSEDNSIRRQEQSDARQNGGYITKQEQGQLNHEENGLQRHRLNRDNSGAGNSQFQTNHPRRSEVLGRDANLNSQLNQDKGDLSGQYGNLKSEDQSIRRQEQRDARKNGGYITQQQQAKLNSEESNLQSQINTDK